MKKTSCTQCIAISKSSGNQCKNKTCKYSPYCYVHRIVNVKESSIPNSGLGICQRRLEKRFNCWSVYRRHPEINIESITTIESKNTYLAKE